jgi:hypothetical protein
MRKFYFLILIEIVSITQASSWEMTKNGPLRSVNTDSIENILRLDKDHDKLLSGAVGIEIERAPL